jgi:hypothetical protein
MKTFILTLLASVLFAIGDCALEDEIVGGVKVVSGSESQYLVLLDDEDVASFETASPVVLKESNSAGKDTTFTLALLSTVDDDDVEQFFLLKDGGIACQNPLDLSSWLFLGIEDGSVCLLKRFPEQCAYISDDRGKIVVDSDESLYLSRNDDGQLVWDIDGSGNLAIDLVTRSEEREKSKESILSKEIDDSLETSADNFAEMLNNGIASILAQKRKNTVSTTDSTMTG